MARTQDVLASWILTSGRRYQHAGFFLEGLCEQLGHANLEVHRATLGAPLLHPVAQSVFAVWEDEKGLKVNWAKWDEDGLAKLRESPIHAIYTAGRGTRWSLADPEERTRFAIGTELFDAGFTDYFALALPFTDGTHKALTFQTRAAGGFSAETLGCLEELVDVVATVVEGYMQRTLAKTLMETYVGSRAGARVLEGQISRGDGEYIEAVVWFSDLRGFTQLAADLRADELLRTINHYFDAVARAVHHQDGEVLKFIGDAVLAIFPITGPRDDACRRAENALDEVSSAVEAPTWPAGLQFGTALHCGTVFYGNVGGETRLDFTVIGGAVNVVSRIEGLCGNLGESVLVSKEFAQGGSEAYVSRGAYELKGVPGETEVFALSRS